MDAVIWLLSLIAGVALGLLLRSPVLAQLLGFGLFITVFVLFGYSFNYPNYYCGSGEPCPTDLRLIEIVNPVLFWLGSTLFLVAFGRNVWRSWRGWRVSRRHRASSR